MVLVLAIAPTLKRWYFALTLMTGHGTPFTMLMSPNRLSSCSSAENTSHSATCPTTTRPHSMT